VILAVAVLPLSAMAEPNDIAANEISANQSAILTHAVLIGLTPLIPIPFLDDAIKSYLQRRLVRSLASARGVRLESEDVKTLADDASGGCLRGCLGTIVVYPISKISRKILFLLEWKRAVDLVSISYHRGFVVDDALANAYLERHGAPGVRAAVDVVVRETPVRPVEEAVRATFRQSKSALVAIVATMQRALGGLGRGATPDEVGAALEPARGEEAERVKGVVASLGERINAVPRDHFDAMRRRLAEILG
jgi:hypothetical protein